MIYIGLLCFGLFVGTLLCLGLSFIADIKAWQKAATYILGAVLSAALLKFLDILGSKEHPDAISGYPIGLFIALLWSFNGRASVRLQSPDPRVQFFGWLQLTWVILITVVLVTYTVLHAPMEPIGVQLVFGLAVVMTFAVIGFLLYHAYRALQYRNGRHPDGEDQKSGSPPVSGG